MELNGTCSHFSPRTIWSPQFICLFIVNALLNLSIYTAYSQLSLYAQKLGGTAAQIGTLLSTFAITALIFRFVSGPSINTFNPKKLLLIAMFILSFSYAGYSAAPRLSVIFNMKVITVLRMFSLVQGVGNAFANACCLTLVSNVLPAKHFTTGMGYYACAQVISQAFGPTLGILISSHIGFEKTYVAICCCMFIAILSALSIKSPNKNSCQKIKIRLSDSIAVEAIVPALVIMLVAIGFMATNTFLLIYCEQRNIPHASWFFTIYALVMFISRPQMGKLTDRWGFVRVGIPSILSTAVSLLLIAYSSSFLSLVVSAIFGAFGYGAAQPALQSLCMKAVSPEHRGSASCTSFIGLDAATLIGPAICGHIAGIYGYSHTMWLAMMVPCFLGALITFLFRKRINSVEQQFLKKGSHHSIEQTAKQ